MCFAESVSASFGQAARYHEQIALLEPFLIIDVGGPQKALGYLELARVRTILPTHGVFSVDVRRANAALVSPSSS